uniref:Peptidase S1 domain-containing protein n=1 Tax=Castor canadensis TaxID=51338 RepID=A0A8C0WE88_CASCN
MYQLLFFVMVVLPFSPEAGKIKWGREVTPHSQPYMAFVKFYDLQLAKKRCGAFLVQDNIVIMTAAHCNGSKINVTLGAHDIKQKENTQQVIPVVKAIPHQNYNIKTKVNNIMLMKLKYKAQLNAYVNTIALPNSQDWVIPGQVCSVAGWGKLSNGNLETLQEVNLKVQNEQKCRNIFPNYNKSIQLCVGNPKDKKATDSGDSRGLFVCNNVSQGIVSYKCHSGKLPQVFTRISSFMLWIKKTIKQLKHL